MLEELRVKNYALIDDLTVRFGGGFNALTGETGAGKSILIDALSLALGGKGKGDGVRQGADEAEVTAVLRTSNTVELREWSAKYAIEPEDDVLLIRRTLRENGRGTTSIQAVPVTRGALAELASFQVDIHGQHEHQSLFRIATHRKLLDRYAGLEARVNAFTAQFSHLSELGKRIDELNRNEGQMAREAEFLRHALEEIESAALREGEEEELEERQKILSRHEELAKDLEKALETSAESRNGALALLRKTREGLNKAADIDSTVTELVKRLDGAFYEIEDIVDEIRQRRDAENFDPSALEAVEERLTLIRSLERKYASTSVAGIIDYLEQARVRLNEFDSRDSDNRKLCEERKQLQELVIAEAMAISRKRNSAAASLQKRVEEHLKALGMIDARFTVSLAGKRSEGGRAVVGPYGVDDIEFLLSANRGEAPKPLKSVVSGGELSRVMLALKTVLIESDPVPAMIFDEVDTGIGGEVARSVGEHLHKLSGNKQVFCITHLASIAVFADNHLQVKKAAVDGRTVTRIREVEGESRIREVARMLAGDKEDAASREHASRLLKARGWCLDVTEVG